MWIAKMLVHRYTGGKITTTEIKSKNIKEAMEEHSKIEFPDEDEIQYTLEDKEIYRWFLVNGTYVEVFDNDDEIFGIAEFERDAIMAVSQHFAGTIANTSFEINS